jgi:hypothetical protein
LWGDHLAHADCRAGSGGGFARDDARRAYWDVCGLTHAILVAPPDFAIIEIETRVRTFGILREEVRNALLGVAVALARLLGVHARLLLVGQVSRACIVGLIAEARASLVAGLLDALAVVALA